MEISVQGIRLLVLTSLLACGQAEVDYSFLLVNGQNVATTPLAEGAELDVEVFESPNVPAFLTDVEGADPSVIAVEDLDSAGFRIRALRAGSTELTAISGLEQSTATLNIRLPTEHELALQCTACLLYTSPSPRD